MPFCRTSAPGCIKDVVQLICRQAQPACSCVYLDAEVGDFGCRTFETVHRQLGACVEYDIQVPGALMQP